MSQSEPSNQREGNSKPQPSSPKGNYERDIHAEPLSNPARGNDTNTKHLIERSKRDEDGSLAWFDSLEESNTDAEEAFQKTSLLPKVSPNNSASKTLCKTSCSEERTVSVLRKGSRMRDVNLHPPLEQNKVSTINRKRPEGHNCFSSEANTQDQASPSASVQGSVITQRVSKSWQRLHKEKSHGFFTSTQDPEASLLPASDLPDLSSDADSILGEEKSSISVAAKTATISMRKRSKGQVVKETKVVSSHEPETPDSENPPEAKLAKFSFRRRTKLEHSLEKKNEEFSLLQSETIFKPGEQLPEECCVPEKCERTPTCLGKTSLEKQSIDDKGREEQQALRKKIRGHATIRTDVSFDAVSSPSTEKTREGEEKLGDPSTGKVHSSTLAKLSAFSFASLHESKLETLPTVKSDKESHSPLLKVHVKNPSRRKSFSLGNAGKASVVTQKSLFSIAELDDATLDFDWDEEVRKNTST